MGIEIKHKITVCKSGIEILEFFFDYKYVDYHVVSCNEYRFHVRGKTASYKVKEIDDNSKVVAEHEEEGKLLFYFIPKKLLED